MCLNNTPHVIVCELNFQPHGRPSSILPLCNLWMRLKDQCPIHKSIFPKEWGMGEGRYSKGGEWLQLKELSFNSI